MNARSSIGTAMSASGDWKKNMYQDFRSWSYEKKAVVSVGGGGTAIVTSRRHRAVGWWTAE